MEKPASPNRLTRRKMAKTSRSAWYRKMVAAAEKKVIKRLLASKAAWLAQVADGED
jgi:hypothetical protein